MSARSVPLAVGLLLLASCAGSGPAEPLAPLFSEGLGTPPFAVLNVQLRSGLVPVDPMHAWGHLQLTIPLEGCTTCDIIGVSGVLHNPLGVTFVSAEIFPANVQDAAPAGTLIDSFDGCQPQDPVIPTDPMLILIGGTVQLTDALAASILANPAGYFLQISSLEIPTDPMRGSLGGTVGIPPDPIQPGDPMKVCRLQLGGIF